MYSFTSQFFQFFFQNCLTWGGGITLFSKFIPHSKREISDFADLKNLKISPDMYVCFLLTTHAATPIGFTGRHVGELTGKSLRPDSGRIDASGPCWTGSLSLSSSVRLYHNLYRTLQCCPTAFIHGTGSTSTSPTKSTRTNSSLALYTAIPDTYGRFLYDRIPKPRRAMLKLIHVSASYIPARF